MSFEPNNITKQHVEKAIARIEGENIQLTGSTLYDVVINGKAYPPKEIMRYAHEEMNGEHIWNNNGGEQTNKYLKAMGFEIREKNQSGNKFDDLLNRYAEKARETKNEGELYKWRLLKTQRGKPDVNASNFFESVKATDFKNLMYGVGIGATRHLASDRTEPFRECFKLLFDESLDLGYRVKEFNSRTLTIYRELVPEKRHSHHQDERTIATYLTYHNPDKYTFYKDSFYSKYCKFLGIKPKKPLEKYVHYLEMINELINEHIIYHKELLQLKSELLDKDCYQDPQNKILAQDILYQMFDLGLEEIDIGNNNVYKISMGEFPIDELEGFIANGVVLVHANTKPKGQSYEAQGVTFKDVIQVGDYFYLTHGNQGVKLLGRFTSEARKCSNTDYGDDGWLEREFEILLNSINQSSYKGTNRWWTPNNNSTCIKVKTEELQEANKLIFKPYFNAELIKSESENEEQETVEENQPTNMKEPLNQILYGPPGTGKTFNAIHRAVAIANSKFDLNVSRENLKLEFDRLVKEELIGFTTFHQSMSYEDFIEGIKPNLEEEKQDNVGYNIQPGIFKRMCSKAGEKKITKNNFMQAYDSLLSEIKKNKDSLILETPVHSREFTIYENSKGNLRFHANTEKAYEGVIKKDVIEHYLKTGEALDWSSYTKAVGKYLEENHSYSQTQEEAADDFVLIIDEINRGNVSSIFGELITLIEEDKRAGAKESLVVTLPYSKKPFSVPSNLYIIGTMNTADRSVEALDTALRRRFSFAEYLPQANLVRKTILNHYHEAFVEMWELGWKDKDWLAFENKFKQLLVDTVVYDQHKAELEALVNKGKEQAEDTISFFTKHEIQLFPEKLMSTINLRIEKLIDKDHMIGHSYFMNVFSLQDLKKTMKNKVLPLLQEYFFGDYGKIGLVLGSGFFEISDMADGSDSLFADFDYSEKSSLERREVYRIKDVEGMTDEEFLKSLKVLLKIA